MRVSHGLYSPRSGLEPPWAEDLARGALQLAAVAWAEGVGLANVVITNPKSASLMFDMFHIMFNSAELAEWIRLSSAKPWSPGVA